MGNRLRELEIELSKIPTQVEKHEERLKDLEIFKAQVLVIVTVGSIFGGLAADLIKGYIIR